MKALSFLVLFALIALASGSRAATTAPSGTAGVFEPGPAARPTFPLLLAAAQLQPSAVETPARSNRATLALELVFVLGASAGLARALPRNRKRRRGQAARAAREISWIRWTMARKPFER